MKKTMKLTLCLILVLSTVLCMAACGGDKNSIAGKYVVYSMDSNGMTIKGDTLTAALSAMGMTIDDMYIQLNDDGTGKMSVFGETADMAYADGKIWPVEEPEEKVSFTVSGGKLTLEVEGNKMVFTKK